MAQQFSILDFFGRWLLTALLVFGTYNPTDYSYLSWITSDGMAWDPVPALVSVLLLIAWLVFLRNTFLAIGPLGIILCSALVACIIWLLIDWGVFSIESSSAVAWAVLAGLSLVLAIGLSWPHIRRGLTGQLTVDDVED